MKLPDKIKVGAFDIQVIQLQGAESLSHGIDGHFSAAEQVIRIDKSLAKYKLMDTLLHEILHSIYYVGHLDSDDDEEKTVSVISTMLTQVIRDNPKLLKFWQATLG